MRTSTFGARCAAAVLSLCALGAAPALAESPETFVDAHGVHYAGFR